MLTSRYEIFDSNDETTDKPIMSQGTAKTWQRKYFWLQAVTFFDEGRYEIKFSPDCKKYQHLAPISFHLTAVPSTKGSMSVSSGAAGKRAGDDDDDDKEDEDDEVDDDEEEDDSDEDEDSEVAASMAGFHPRQLKDMPRVEMQHLMVKINRPAKVGNDDLRRALTDWWEKRQAKGRPVSSG